MKKIHFTLIFSILSFWMNSLSAQVHELEYIDYPLNCAFSSPDTSNIVINTQADFKEYVANCPKSYYADYEDYSIVSVERKFGGCQLHSKSFTITKDTIDKKYTVKTNLSTTGICRMYIRFTKVVLVEKLDPEYEVVFEHTASRVRKKQ